MLHRSTQQAAARREFDWRHPSILTAVPATLLVLSGIIMFALYIALDVTASLAYDGYNYKDQTISELSAIGAPTRAYWLALSPVYQILAFAFAVGVLRVAGERRPVRVAGWLLLALAVVGLLWWIAPMHRREVLAADDGTWQDVMHLVVGGVTSLLYFVLIGVGAFAFGRWFRLYSFATIVALLVFGTLMSFETGGVGENEPTPWLGIYERIAVEGSMLWQAVFAVVLLRYARKWRTAGPAIR
ncbi:MAG: DUF998 domain-containing protein [Dehalococcoidia bacterium]|nr:DUF998 domain-containing protein [Dehalococcoidia bacterium]